MFTRPLGNTGLQVGPIALGAVKLGRDRGLKYPATGGAVSIPTDDQAVALLAAVLDESHGTQSLIDTAPAYGIAEERLGLLLAQVAPRERWLLCTKAGEEFDETASGGAGASRYNFRPEVIRASIERSLVRLRTDAVDIAMLHLGGPLAQGSAEEQIITDGEALGALRTLQSEGKVRAVGASPAGLAAARAAIACCDVVMLSYNPLAPEMGPMIDAAHDAGVGVLIKKALASGHLVDPQASSVQADPIRSALRFALARPGASCVVLGTSNPAHYRLAAAAARGILEGR